MRHSGALKENIRNLCKNDYMPEKGYYSILEHTGIGKELSEDAMTRAEHHYVN